MEERKLDHIGKVTLDLTNYPGEDKYCDGDVEDTLLEIARDRSSAEYQSIIEESKSWPILYHLSPLRENIAEWLPIDKSMKVLEVGAGCGAITGVLARKAGSVTCCDLSLKRSRINAYRHMDCDNVCIHVGNFGDVEKDLDTDYDYICLIGVFEYAQAYMNTEDPYGDFLKLLKKHCKKAGNIAIAIENKFGLKYWAGCREDHLGSFFSSIEDYPDGGVVRTFTDRELIGIARRCGFTQYRMYYPYPDYKFASEIFSDNRLPHIGECKNNIRNMDRDRYLLFNEKNAFDSILKEGLFHLYSNSYMLILGPAPTTDYVRYSNDRLPDYAICTEMATVEKRPVIKKRALDPAAAAHIKKYSESCAELTKRYEGSRLNINKCSLSEDGTELLIDFVKGETLESMLDNCLARNDMEAFTSLFKEYLGRISFGEENAKITDLDLVFSNILVDGDDWTVIDYEWTTDRPRTAREVAFRAVYCYVLEDEKRDKLSLELITDMLGISDSDAKDLRDDEMSFQKEITGKHKSLDEIREAIGNAVYSLDGVEKEKHRERPELRAQLYLDNFTGFREEKSQFFDSAFFECDLPGELHALRIDPCSAYCLVRIDHLCLNGAELPRGIMNLKTNGKKIGNDLYIFNTDDPQFMYTLRGIKQERMNKLSVSMSVTVLDRETAGRLQIH